MEVHAGDQARGLKQRCEFLTRGARVGGALQHHQLALGQVPGERLGGAEHGAQVGLAVFIEWRGQTDDDRLHIAHAIPGGGCLDKALLHQRREAWRRNVFDVRLAGIHLCHAWNRRIEPQHGHSRLGKHHGERQPHVAEADDADALRGGGHGRPLWKM